MLLEMANDGCVFSYTCEEHGREYDAVIASGLSEHDAGRMG